MTKIFCRHSSIFLLLGIILLSASFCVANELQTPDAQFVAPKKLKQKTEKKMEAQQPVKLNGILVNAVQANKPFEGINPFAPASAGNGEDTIEEDPNLPGKPQGFILFGVQW